MLCKAKSSQLASIIICSKLLTKVNPAKFIPFSSSLRITHISCESISNSLAPALSCLFSTANNRYRTNITAYKVYRELYVEFLVC